MSSRRFVPALMAALLLALAAASVQSSVSSPRQGVALSPHDPIYVNGDANFTAANGVVGGSGTPGNPYVISGWWINVTYNLTTLAHWGAVTLVNTNATVVVEDLLVNVTYGDPEIGSPNAVNIVSSHNVTVENVTSRGQNSLAQVRSSSHVLIANSTALNTNQLGLAADVWVWQSDDVVVLANTLTLGVPGIDVWGSSHVQLLENVVVPNPNWGGITVESSSNVTIEGGNVQGWISATTVQDLTVATVGLGSGGSVFIRTATRVLVEDNTFSGGTILLNYTRDSWVSGNVNVSQIWLAYSPSWNTTIASNEVVGGSYGIYGWEANDVLVEGNNVSSESSYGVVFVYGQNVTVTGNRISDSATGIFLSQSSGVLVFHNDFSHNLLQASVSGGTSLRWNESYPVGGNYWSDYTGVDNCSGPLQNNCTGGDGIGDTPYVIDASDADYYPIMAFLGQDTTPPVVAITAPTDGATSTSSPISVTGTASDAGGSGLRDVQVRVNGGPWNPASGLATWSASVPLAPGFDLIEAWARDWAGNSGTAAVGITYAPPPPPPNTPPYANFSWSPSSGDTSTVFTFTSTSYDSQDPPSALQVRWDWQSDGIWDTSWSTNPSATHQFPTVGTYNVTLEVMDTGGLTANRIYAVVVTAVPPPPPPALAATIVVAPSSGTMPLTVTFNSTVTGGVAPYQYDWHLGDGSTSPAANTVHIYLTGGNFTVWLTVHDHAGSSVLSNVLWVNVTPAAVNLSVVPIIPTNFTANLSGITLWLSATVSGGTPPYTFYWTFGDGGSSTAASPVHTYAKSGTYNVSVTVTDSAGHTAKKVFTLSVPACPGCGLPSYPPYALWALVSSLVAVVVAAIVFALRSRRKPRPPEGPPTTGP